MSDDVIFLDDKALKRMELVDRIQLMVAAGALVLSSLERFQQPGTKDLVLAALQAITSLTVIGFVVAWMAKRHVPSASRVGWLDLMAGVMLLVEWGDRVIHGGKLFSAVFCQAAVFITLGLLQARITERRQLRRSVRVDDDGLTVQRSRFRRFRVAWNDVASVVREPRAISITLRNGKDRRISLGRFENGDDVAQFILHHADARGVATPAGA